MQKEGWDFHEPADNSRTPEQVEKAQELAVAYATVFNSPYGEIVLAHLKKSTIEATSLSQYHNDGVNTAINMAWREGQNHIVRTIMHYTKTGKENK